jgi:hypothetical protein
MAQKTSASTRFNRARAQWLDKHGYISCTTAMSAATERLAKGEQEVALMFCDLSRELLQKSEVYVRSMVGECSQQPQAA